MSSYIEPLPDDPDDDEEEGPPLADPAFRCTECEYGAPRSEFQPDGRETA